MSLRVFEFITIRSRIDRCDKGTAFFRIENKKLRVFYPFSYYLR